jgi:hypothetical protein
MQVRLGAEYEEVARAARARVKVTRYSAELRSVRQTYVVFARERWPGTYDRPRRLRSTPLPEGTAFGLTEEEEVVAARTTAQGTGSRREWYRTQDGLLVSFVTDADGLRCTRVEACERDKHHRISEVSRWGNRYAWRHERYTRDADGLVRQIDMLWTNLINEDLGEEKPQQATQVLRYAPDGSLESIEEHHTRFGDRVVYQATKLTVTQALRRYTEVIERTVREHLERQPASAIALIYTTQPPYLHIHTAGPDALADGLDNALWNTNHWPDSTDLHPPEELQRAARHLTQTAGMDLTTERIRAAILPIATSLNHHPPAGSPPDFLAIATDTEQEDNDRNTPTMLTPAQHQRWNAEQR